MSGFTRAPLAAWLAPEYPGVDYRQARALREGQSPRQIARSADAQSDLSAAEAHRWLSTAPQSEPLAWLCSQAGLPTMRSWLVARWALRVQATPVEHEALLRVRTLQGPAGEQIQVRYWDRLDEIQDCDLDLGIRTGVQRAYEHAAARVTEARLAELARDYRVLREPPAWRLGARARFLATAAALVEEGKAMKHCVGGYASAVQSGRSVIVSIRCGSHRSTAELSRSGLVLQHHAQGNAAPDRICVSILGSILRRNGLAKGGSR